MNAILKREFRAYFLTPLGYVLIAAMAFFTNYYFFTYNLYGATTDFSTLFSMLFPVVLFLVPVLTMRLLSEDKRLKTDQLLLTAPISRISIVLGKYLAALFVYLIAISFSMIDALIASIYAAVEWPVVIGHFAGLFLLGAALIAVCMFLSGLTESQVIAAVLGFVVSLFLMLIDALSYVVSNAFLQEIFHYMSFNDRYVPFTYGILDFSNALFFLSFAALFLFLSTAVLEKRRWS
ncbi:MAG TPA: ABC-2 transporter permease [Candidatus Pullichristensenella excrementigallinarum]|uniref:ABC-2 transporter permease n=1 Tax=Candidatus Pullichristensenella excrementigallinarum TaxID=2840907 RepID=A0A9D1IBA0_9FIRM|nr:ABC-2 transporter permease [Candidatus Pullichristensenella excrementigallinarum]